MCTDLVDNPLVSHARFGQGGTGQVNQPAQSEAHRRPRGAGSIAARLACEGPVPKGAGPFARRDMTGRETASQKRTGSTSPPTAGKHEVPQQHQCQTAGSDSPRTLSAARVTRPRDRLVIHPVARLVRRLRGLKSLPTGVRPAAACRQASESAALHGRHEATAFRDPPGERDHQCTSQSGFGTAQLGFEIGLGLRCHHQTLTDRIGTHNRRHGASHGRADGTGGVGGRVRGPCKT
jgi:hypothetical protein